jgi:uncharacterized repeat protein (TIGR02543 family)
MSFYARHSFTSIILPEGITSIGSVAFWFCDGLTSITIPEGVTSIKEGAFHYCIGLRSITLPAGLTSIESLAFSSCLLNSVTILNPVPIIIGDDVFNLPDYPSIVLSDCELRVPSSSVAAYKEANVWKEFRVTAIDDGYTVTVTADKGTATGGGVYDMEASAVVEATPSAGYKFANWTNASDGTVLSTNNPYTFTVTEDTELKANFDAIVYKITYSLDGGDNHAGNPSTYTFEDAVTLQAPSKQGYDFAGWTEGGRIVAGSTGDKTFTAQWGAHSDEANIEYIAVNGRDITESENSGVFAYIQTCGESELSKKLTLRVSPKASVKIGETLYPASAELETSLDIRTTNFTITVISESGKTNTYTLELTGVIDGSLLYHLRWNDVIGINSNPENNGGRIVNNEYTRWYYSSDNTEIGSGDYIEINGDASDYYAVIELEGERYRVCHPLTKTAEIKAYPNPVPRGETITLELPESATGGVLNIYNINGSLVKSALPLPATVNSIDLSGHVPAGIYLFQVNGKNGKRQTIKIITE